MTKDVPSFILNPCPFEYGNSNRGLLGGFNSSYASYIVSPSRLGFQKKTWLKQPGLKVFSTSHARGPSQVFIPIVVWESHKG